MKALRNYLDKIKPNFEEGGKFAMFRSVFDGFETFLFVPNSTSKTGVHIHDSIDSKRTMIVVVIALLPALLFGMYNVGYQHNLAIGANPGFWATFAFGLLAVLPKIIVSYVVGLGIEFAVAQWKKEEIQEGFLVSGILIPMIVPVDTPLWMIAVATAFAVIFAKEVSKVDPLFFIRLNNSRLFVEDKDNRLTTDDAFFADPDFKDKQYYLAYPTIYHLRAVLISGEVKDIRLLYLAVHHLIKNRGHFLFEGQSFDVGNKNLVKEKFYYVNNIFLRVII